MTIEAKICPTRPLQLGRCKIGWLWVTLAVIAFASVCACQGHGARGDASLQTLRPIARPVAPWPKGTPECRIAGDGIGVGSFTMYASPAAADEIAIVSPTRISPVPVEWSRVPVLGERARAQAKLTGQFELQGWAELKSVNFLTRRQVDIVPKHVWLPAGTRVTLLGTAGGQAAIRAPTPFREPSAIETTIACDDLAFSTTAVSVPTATLPAPRPAAVSDAAVQLYDAPGGALIASVRPASTSHTRWGPFSSQGRDGHTPIRIGGVSVDPCLGNVAISAFDVWVRTNALKEDAAPEQPDSSSCDELADHKDSCDTPAASVLLGTAVRLEAGQASAGVAVAHKGLRVHAVIRERQDRYMPIELPFGEIRAPRGRRFWIEANSLRDESGCPGLEPYDRATSGAGH